jgi:hypothetical protein
MGIARLLARWRARRAAHALEREARRSLSALFERPERLRGTSLRPEHRSRVLLSGYEVDEGRVARVFFTILRHPRPYPFSRQVHEVVERWRLDLPSFRVERLEGLNLSRLRGSDGEPSTQGGGI